MAIYDEFLARPRQGMFCTAHGEGWSTPVPVWFEWDGAAVRLFSYAAAPKVARLRADPRAHLLAPNQMDEAAVWVSFTGTVELGDVDIAWLRQLAGRYWDLDDPARAATVQGWVDRPETLVGLTLTPTKIRHYGF